MEKPDQKKDPLTHCPHCGRELSPWEQVLLSVDRALMCKSCWYRIVIIDPDDCKPTDSPKRGD